MSMLSHRHRIHCFKHCNFLNRVNIDFTVSCEHYVESPSNWDIQKTQNSYAALFFHLWSIIQYISGFPLPTFLEYVVILLIHLVDFV